MPLHHGAENNPPPRLLTEISAFFQYSETLFRDQAAQSGAQCRNGEGFRFDFGEAPADVIRMMRVRKSDDRPAAGNFGINRPDDFNGIPLILETPDPSIWADEIKLLRSFEAG